MNTTEKRAFIYCVAPFWRRLLFLAVFLSAGSILPAFGSEGTPDFKRFPVKGKVTLIDLGSNSCIPCKMMAPILEKVKEKYKGKAEVVVIDAWKHRDQAQRFKIRAIPTQVFFDIDGKEVFRHLGFMSEKDIVLKNAGVGCRLTECFVGLERRCLEWRCCDG